MSPSTIANVQSAAKNMFEWECRIPILASIDCGMSGAIIRNDDQGNLHCHKMPTQDKGIDLYAIADILRGADMVIMEKPPMGGFTGHTSRTENSCHNQYKELYGLCAGIQVPFYTITPQQWQNYLGFPKKRTVGDDKVWKRFLQDQAIQRFPKQKVTLYAGDAFLLYDVLRKLYPIDRQLWP